MTDPSFQLRVPSSGPVVTGTPGYVLTFGADGRSVSGMPGGGGGGAVSSVFGRTGAVVAAAGDYAASQVVNDSSVPGFTVKDALNSLLAGGGGVVLSVFGRIGAVVAANGDYTTSLVTNASTVTGATTTDALNTVQTHLTSLDGSVVALGSLIAGLQASNIHNNSAGPGTTVADTLTAYNTHLTSLDGSVVSLGSLIAGLQASNIANNSSVTGASVKDALNTLLTTTGGLVASVNVAGALTVAGTSTAPIVTTLGGFRSGVLDNTARDAIPAAQRDVGTTAYVVGTDKTWRLIGGTANANWVDVTIAPVTTTAPGLVPALGTVSLILQSTGSAAAWAIPLTWDATIAGPTISQVANNTNGAVGQTLTDQAQNATGTGATGGNRVTQSGSGTATASGLGTGGTALAHGSYQIKRGPNTVAGWFQDGTDFMQFGVQPGQGGTGGPAAASAGTIRGTAKFTLKARKNNDAGDAAVIDVGTTSGTDSLTIGDTTSGGTFIVGPGTAGVQIKAGSQQTITASNTNVTLGNPLLQFNNSSTPNPVITQIAETTATTSSSLTIAAQSNTQAASTGGAMQVDSGAGTANSGPVRLRPGGVVQAEMAILSTRRIWGLFFGANITTTQAPAGTGDGVELLANASIAPTVAPAAGGLLRYAIGGNPAWWTPNATKTTIGAAGPAAALPALPLFYIPMTHNGVSCAIPAYTP